MSTERREQALPRRLEFWLARVLPRASRRARRRARSRIADEPPRGVLMTNGARLELLPARRACNIEGLRQRPLYVSNEGRLGPLLRSRLEPISFGFRDTCRIGWPKGVLKDGALRRNSPGRLPRVMTITPLCRLRLASATAPLSSRRGPTSVNGCVSTSAMSASLPSSPSVPANTIRAGKVGVERRNSVDTPVGDANIISKSDRPDRPRIVQTLARRRIGGSV